MLRVLLIIFLILTGCWRTKIDEDKKAKDRRGINYDVTEISMNEVKSISSTSLHKFDTNGNLIEYSFTDNFGNMFGKRNYKYNSENKIKEEIFYDTVTVYQYDVFRNMTEGKEYNENGKLISTFIKRYDDKSNVIEHANFNKEGVLNWKWIYKYKYDDKGNTIETGCYNKDGKLKVKFITKYYDNGNPAEEEVINEVGLFTEKYIYRYDAEGNITASEVYYITRAFGGDLVEKLRQLTIYEYSNY